MALFSSDVLNPGVQRRELFGWAMYDFANSGYTTVVITAVFAAYFVGGVKNLFAPKFRGTLTVTSADGSTRLMASSWEITPSAASFSP